MSDPLLNEAEHAALEHLGACWNLLARCVGFGPGRNTDLTEMGLHIHALQNAVMAQAAARAYPEKYRLLGGGPV